ncbi:Dihydrolipoamide dehydrogenase of branched-chain alpha-keto acid dehydrogenase [hydrothermal vent metagenome]|uniref:dihydrolipoyl dehydrogenase n=1 Tax=hydrothermal vent metagenome TaxID=652676 RepID=A0A3B0UTY6_9ZZZZ
MSDLDCKLLVIGAGPGGYVCAIRAGQLGIDTIIVEAAKVGGTCLNVGCIPSKALIHAANEFYDFSHCAASPIGISASEVKIDLGQTIAWKDKIVTRLDNGVAGLLKRAKTRLISGTARFLDGKTIEVATDDGPQIIRAENIVVATGSAPVELAELPFGGDVISSTEALSLTELPENLAIVGGGYIGMEIGTAMAKLGAKVTIVELQGSVLPLYDAEIVKPVLKNLNKLGVEILVNSSAMGVHDGVLEIKNSTGKSQRIKADKILVTVGRRPRTGKIGLDELSLTMDGAFIGIDEKCQTSMRGVFAIGDVTGEPMLAHRAMAQGEMVAEIIAGKPRLWNKMCVPSVCFTDPEIVECGMSAVAAKSAGIEIKTGQFPLAANGRAMTMEQESGFVRVVARADNNLILGLQAVGGGISELSAAFSIAIEMGARLDDIGATIHAHPTLSEGLQEACLKALGHAIHI